NERGWIISNEYLETSKPNIWCVGDINGLYQFRHKANYELKILKKNIFSEEKHMVEYSSVPWAIFTYPQIGHVGMTEAEAIEKGHDVHVGIHHYSEIAKGYAMGFEDKGDDDGFVKLIADKNHKILGAHIIGPFAAILVQQFVYLMNAGFTCVEPEEDLELSVIPKHLRACPEGGTLSPIENSMIIHPSLNELTAWAIGVLKPVKNKKD
ncbi:MAG: dihydrolipoyl dehydrogenase family protein, partial [Promethearchaeota archaeon]